MGLQTIEMVTLVFYFIIAVVTVFANGTVILALCFVKRLRSTSNYFIVSLSFADFCIGLVTIPLRAIEILRPDFTNSIDYCRVAHAFTLLNFTASITNLTVITVDRYIAILHPYFYYKLNKRPIGYIFGMITSAWLVVIIVTYLPLYAWGSNGLSGPRMGPGGICRFNETLRQDYILFILITILATSFLVIVPMYIHILTVAKRHLRRVGPSTSSGERSEGAQQQQQQQQQQNASLAAHLPKPKDGEKMRKKRFVSSFKSTKTMFLIVLIFLVSWLAFVISTLMFIICKQCANSAVVLLATVMVYLGSALNPFVYLIRFKVFRQEVKRIWMNFFT